MARDNHHPRAPAQGLDEACADQPFKARRKGASQRRNGKQRDPDQQWHPPTEAIRHRAVAQLADGQTQEVSRQRQLDVFFVSAERQCNCRENRAE